DGLGRRRVVRVLREHAAQQADLPLREPAHRLPERPDQPDHAVLVEDPVLDEPPEALQRGDVALGVGDGLVRHRRVAERPPDLAGELPRHARQADGVDTGVAQLAPEQQLLYLLRIRQSGRHHPPLSPPWSRTGTPTSWLGSGTYRRRSA